MSKKPSEIEIFKEGIRKVSTLLEIPCQEITRDVYNRTTVDNDIPRLNKMQLNALGGFKSLMVTYFNVKTKEQLEQERVDNLVQTYVNYVVERGITPSVKVLKSLGFPSAFVTKHFKSMRGLYQHCSDQYPKIFHELVNDTLFTEEAFEELKKKVKKHKRFVITTAVSGKEVPKQSMDALRTYCELEDAMILVLPCEDVASRNSVFDFELDKELRDCGFVYKDLYLNENLYISSIKVSAKQINPLTGLDRIAQAKGSALLASPKQYLKFVPNSNLKLPHALMTTGAVTVSDYSSDKSMSQRTSYLAEHDHINGAIVVEVEDKDIFHFRQIQFNDDGSFYDFGWKYNADGTADHVSTMKDKPVCVFGDTHAGSHDLNVDKCLQEITESVACKEVIVHDLFDCRFNNHHDIGKVVTRAKLEAKGLTSLMKEGIVTAQWIDDWTSRVDKVTLVKSNHDEALDRYINEGRWAYDAENLYDACLLVRKALEGEDVLKYLITEMVGLKNPQKVNWLKRDEDYEVYGIESGTHGDKGGNGSRGSLPSIEKSYGVATVGHSHTGGILRLIYQVGTSTLLKLGYNSGPSSWTHTMCITYPNGARQLINIVKDKKGKYKYKL